MKAITIRQPWASAVATGLKQYETRSWSTAYRGPVIIHAARSNAGLPHLDIPAFAPLRDKNLPFGAGVAVADIVDVIPTGQHALFAEKRIPNAQIPLGDYAPGRFAWKLENVRPFSQPIPAKGEQGFWDWPLKPLYTFGYTGSTPETLKNVAEALGAILVLSAAEVVVDIRFSARSRAVRWTGKRLVETLGERYAHIRELGNANYKDRDGEIVIADLDAGMHKLLEILLQKPAILLCACQGWQSCHRRVPAEAAAGRYGAIFHHLPNTGFTPFELRYPIEAMERALGEEVAVELQEAVPEEPSDEGGMADRFAVNPGAIGYWLNYHFGINVFAFNSDNQEIDIDSLGEIVTVRGQEYELPHWCYLKTQDTPGDNRPRQWQGIKEAD